MKTSDGKYTSTLEKGFSSELQNLLINNKNKSFKIYNVNGDIVAVNKSETKTLHKNVNNKKELSKQQAQMLNNLYSKSSESDSTVNIDNSLIQPMTDPGLPTD